MGGGRSRARRRVQLAPRFDVLPVPRRGRREASGDVKLRRGGREGGRAGESDRMAALSVDMGIERCGIIYNVSVASGALINLTYKFRHSRVCKRSRFMHYN